MQAIGVAIIGFFGVLLPALLTLGSVHVRHLKRIREEVETLDALPEAFTLERQLAHYLIRESMWEYAESRRRLMSLTPYMFIGLLSTVTATAGFLLVRYGDPRQLFEWPDDPDYRSAGALLALVGVSLYVWALTWPVRAAQKRIHDLDGPPSRLRQLIAREAQQLADRDLSAIPMGVPNSLRTTDRPARWLMKKKWAGLDARPIQPARNSHERTPSRLDAQLEHLDS